MTDRQIAELYCRPPDEPANVAAPDDPTEADIRLYYEQAFRVFGGSKADADAAAEREIEELRKRAARPPDQQ